MDFIPDLPVLEDISFPYHTKRLLDNKMNKKNLRSTMIRKTVINKITLFEGFKKK